MPDAISVARKTFGSEKRKRNKAKVMIAGGGETGYHLANLLGREDFRVVLLEMDAHRCERLAKLLPHATIVQANANRRSVLEDEGGGTVDYFVGCTGNDENNIMAGVEARELGASRVMCVVGRPDYANVVGKLGIDLAVSERDVIARQVLGFLNEGAVISQAKLPNGSIGVFELEVLPGSPITEASLANLPLAGRCLIAAIQRDGFVQVPTAKDVLRVGDIIVALIDLDDTDAIMSLFNPS
jgi:trk system potassium uptake protein TrkA